MEKTKETNHIKSVFGFRCSVLGRNPNTEYRLPNIKGDYTGYCGKNLARNFAELEVLHTICDTDVDRLKDYPQVNKVMAYAEVLGNKEIDAVSISTPPELHYQLTKEALLAGKDVFCEKHWL